MSNLSYNERTAELLQRIQAELPHALLLSGQAGSGLSTTAKDIAGHRLEGIVAPSDREGNLDSSPKGIIRIKQIRDLVSQASTKAKSDRIYIIDNADQMNSAAQNAFLKLLEEPAPHTHFILTTHSPHALLPTIRSRVQELRIEPISHSQSLDVLYAHKVVDETAKAQMLFLAEGKPAELARLANKESYFTTQRNYIRDAREFLQGPIVQQVKLIESYQSNRAGTLELLEAVQQVLAHSARTNASREAVSALDALSRAYDRIAANGNIRLQLMSYILSI